MKLRVIFWVDVLTAAIGISLLLALRTEREVSADLQDEERPHVLKDMLGGIHYVIKTAWLRQFLGIYAAFALMFGPVVFLTPLMGARSFGEESWRLVAHEIAFAVGAIAGGVISSIFADKFKNKVILVVISCGAFGAATLVMGFSEGFIFYLGVMTLLGLTMPFFNTGSMTVMQTHVQPEIMGRIFGLVSIISSGVMPLSMAIFGPLSDLLSVETLLILTGALMVIISLFALRLREMVAIGQSPNNQAP